MQAFVQYEENGPCDHPSRREAFAVSGPTVVVLNGNFSFHPLSFYCSLSLIESITMLSGGKYSVWNARVRVTFV